MTLELTFSHLSSQNRKFVNFAATKFSPHQPLPKSRNAFSPPWAKTPLGQCHDKSAILLRGKPKGNMRHKNFDKSIQSMNAFSWANNVVLD